MDHTDRKKLRERIEAELLTNILPYWLEHTLDQENGGFYGGVTNEGQVVNDMPRSAVLVARILWTFSAAYRQYGKPEYLDMAAKAYDYLTGPLWDSKYGGVYWLVDCRGWPTNDRKHSYAQAFAIYALAEYTRATGHQPALQQAQRLFHYLETYAHDLAYGGYIESRGRAWEALDDMRLSNKEPNCRKSMNTQLHIMEAFTNLLRVWDDHLLRRRQEELVKLFLEKIFDPQYHYFRLFFRDDWTSLNSTISYGHDIEGSWLLEEAAEVLSKPDLMEHSAAAAVAIAQAVSERGLDQDGSLFYEGTPQGVTKFEKHWWGQAEAVVGFWNAYQLSDQASFSRAAERAWAIIEAHFVDRQDGEWFKVLTRDYVPMAGQLKAGPWECPYHNSRACFEMIRRL